MRKITSPSARYAEGGFSLLELLPVLFIISILVAVMLATIHPEKWFYRTRNARRESDLSNIATAISEYTHNENPSIFLNLPTAPNDAIEICADMLTGSCTNMLILSPLVGSYMKSVPMDPALEDSDPQNEHSGYFILRSSPTRFTISAPLSEGGSAVEVTM